jgi:outer membrane protein insertion porin family
MAASLEALRALYLNKGYINFNIINSQLNISEDKKNILLKFQLMKVVSLSLVKPNS